MSDKHGRVRALLSARLDLTRGPDLHLFVYGGEKRCQARLEWWDAATPQEREQVCDDSNLHGHEDMHDWANCLMDLIDDRLAVAAQAYVPRHAMAGATWQ